MDSISVCGVGAFEILHCVYAPFENARGQRRKKEREEEEKRNVSRTRIPNGGRRTLSLGVTRSGGRRFGFNNQISQWPPRVFGGISVNLTCWFPRAKRLTHVAVQDTVVLVIYSAVASFAGR
jgi:hypothetical protein